MFMNSDCLLFSLAMAACFSNTNLYLSFYFLSFLVLSLDIFF